MLQDSLVFYCEWFLKDFSKIYFGLHILYTSPTDLPSLDGNVWGRGSRGFSIGVDDQRLIIFQESLKLVIL